MIAPDKIDVFAKILNAFETGTSSTDYKSIYLYHDGNGKRKQVTLGRGFTSDSGNLQKVMRAYIVNKGIDADYFETKIENSTPSLVADTEFLKRLSKAGNEQAMKDAQDSIFLSEYMSPALQWAERYKFTLPLSVGTIVDSFLHSGTMLGFLMNSFPEAKPTSGGDEKIWITQYLEARKAWLYNKGGLLRNTIYRPNFFLGEITKNNWQLELPLTANGVKL